MIRISDIVSINSLEICHFICLVDSVAWIDLRCPRKITKTSYNHERDVTMPIQANADLWFLMATVDKGWELRFNHKISCNRHEYGTYWNFLEKFNFKAYVQSFASDCWSNSTSLILLSIDKPACHVFLTSILFRLWVYFRFRCEPCKRIIEREVLIKLLPIILEALRRIWFDSMNLNLKIQVP